ncbi:MAG: trigger factor [Candidatus Eisenbacteria bacterium]|uniref:Trigger factor n=1 Tax=Eiseniibacteriota bacterium TaxID=2212470 RepID=A0A538TKG0_UNCEI|nr:MAG: trigger factor [Candidatus Eisenbacteria bacterium]
MKWSVRPTGAWQHTLEIEVPAEDVEHRLDHAARGVQRRAVLPGFRRGHAPLDLVRQNFAERLEQELVEDFVPELTGEAIEAAHLSPVVPPLVRNLKFTPGQPLRFEAVVDVRPEIEARDYRGIPVRRETRPVKDAAVDEMLERLREESAVFADLTRPAERGDVLIVDSVRLDANGRRLPSSRAKNLRLELGAPDLLPELESGLMGAETNQERTIEVSYPADYRVPELAGTRARYLVRVRKIQEKKLRPLDDNFAREVFQLSSLDDLRSRVRANLEADERARVQREVERAITDELVRLNPVDLPERLVQWMLERVMREAVGDRPIQESLRSELEQRYRPGVERSLKREVLLESVARREKLEVGEAEVAAEIDRMAEAEPRHAARVRARYQSAERRRALQESLLERKALEWLIRAADIEEHVAGERQLVIPAAR